MAYLNYFLQFKAFADKNPSNNPSLSLINWVRDVQGVAVENQSGQYLTIPASGSLTVFSGGNTKKFLYVEADGALNAAINGGSAIAISPVVIGSSTNPGSLLLNGTITALILTNPSSTDPVNVFVASAE